uniref:Uncharacterized protein n=1 Tax=Anguilla anguilla TaxID=7936 RepID=A0A0E9QR84_ANGAN
MFWGESDWISREVAQSKKDMMSVSFNVKKKKEKKKNKK